MKPKEVKDKNRMFAKNVSFLIKRDQSKALGEIETNIGVQPGYLSRILTRNNSITLPIAIAFAEEVGFTIDELCGKDFEEKAMIAEIDKQIAELVKKKHAILGGNEG